MFVLLLGADGESVCEHEEDRYISAGIEKDNKSILLLAELKMRRIGSLMPRRMCYLAPRRRTSLSARRKMTSSAPMRRSSLSSLYCQRWFNVMVWPKNKFKLKN